MTVCSAKALPFIVVSSRSINPFPSRSAAKHITHVANIPERTHTRAHAHSRAFKCIHNPCVVLCARQGVVT